MDFDFGSQHKISTVVKDLVSCDLKSDNLQFYKFISYQRAKYTVGDIVVRKRKTEKDLPQFALINTIVYETKTKRFYLLVEDLITESYEKQLNGYIIKEKSDSVQKIITIESLAHYSTLNKYSTIIALEPIEIVVPKYAI